MAPAFLPNGSTRYGRWHPKILRSQKSSPSSAMASTARCACRPTTIANTGLGIEAAMVAATADIVSPVGIVAGAGAMPFAVADQLAARGLGAVILALKGACDPVAVGRYRHHWVSVGQIGKMIRLFRSEGCRDVIFIGGLSRPSLSEVRVDWGSLRLIPVVAAA